MNEINISSGFFIPRENESSAQVFKRVRLMPLYSFPHIRDMNLSIGEFKNRYFMHLDFDAFFAQVEQRDCPALRGKPVSVGGYGKEKGIVMTASYEARKFGVETGMSVWEAKKLCPELLSVPCYGPKYESIMFNLLDILKSFVPDDCMEQYSIDECFIDVTSVVADFSQAHWLALAIKKKVKQEENLTVSIGCSYNKTYAKMATKFQKPDGLTVISPEDRNRIYSLPVEKIWGVGRRIARRLSVMNIITVGDLANSSVGSMRKEFGINGVILRKLARGEDTSLVHSKRPEPKSKSISHNHTLYENVYKENDVIKEIRKVCEYVGRKLRAKKLIAGYMGLVIRYEDLRYAGDKIKLIQYTNDDRILFEAAMVIFRKFPRPCIAYRARMFGLYTFDLQTDLRRENLELFDKRIYLPYYSIDKLKKKYGEKIIRIGIV